MTATKQQLETYRAAAVDCVNMLMKWQIEATLHLRDILRPDLHPHDKPDAPYESIIALRRLANECLDAYDTAATREVLSAIHITAGRAEPVMIGKRAFASWHQAARLCAESVLFAAGYDDAEEMQRATRELPGVDTERMVAEIDLEAAAAMAGGIVSAGSDTAKAASNDYAEHMTRGDAAIEEIKAVYPERINATNIGRKLGCTGDAVRNGINRLPDAAKAMIDFPKTGSTEGYRYKPNPSG